MYPVSQAKQLTPLPSDVYPFTQELIDKTHTPYPLSFISDIHPKQVNPVGSDK